MTSHAPVHFYFDYVSHNAYLAWARLPEIARRHARMIEPRPVLFAGMLKAHGQLGPAEIPSKNEWMLRDVLRKAKRYDIPIAPPASHPFNPLAALRMTCLDLDATIRQRLIDACFRAVWVESRDLSNPAALADIATAAGVDTDQALTEIQSTAIKDRLKQSTDGAIAEGVFGVPTMKVDGMLFWGFDDLDNLDAYLAGNDPLTEEDLSAWQHVRATSHRKR